MRRSLLALLLLLPVASVSAADAALTDPESILTALRSGDKDQALAALSAIPALPGYPKAAEDLMPALLWMADGEDQDPGLVAAARLQAESLGWPKAYCLTCVKRMAAREDALYKMMALSMLSKLAWDDPGAMTILLEVNRNHSHGTGTMIRAFASLVRERSCGSQLEMDAWNSRAVHLRERMINALHEGGPKMRPIAEALLTCPLLDPMIAAEAQAVLDSTPKMPH